MSLERQDVRAKIDFDDHRALVRICEIDGVTIAEFVEAIVVPVIRKRVHDAILLAQHLQGAGTTGKGRE